MARFLKICYLRRVSKPTLQYTVQYTEPSQLSPCKTLATSEVCAVKIPENEAQWIQEADYKVFFFASHRFRRRHDPTSM